MQEKSHEIILFKNKAYTNSLLQKHRACGAFRLARCFSVFCIADVFGAGAALCGVFGRHIELFDFKGGLGQRVFIFAVFYAQPHCEKGGNIVIR